MGSKMTKINHDYMIFEWFLRRNAYTWGVYGENVAKLKQVTYLKEAPIPKFEELLKTNTETDDEDTEYFSLDSDSSVLE